MSTKKNLYRRIWEWLSSRIFYGLLLAMLLIIVISTSLLVLDQRQIEMLDAQNKSMQMLRSHFGSLRNYIVLSDLGMRGYGVYPNEKLLNPHSGAIKNYTVALAELKEEIALLDLNSQGFEDVERAFAVFFEHNDAVIKEMLSGNFEPVKTALKENESGKKVLSVLGPFESRLKEEISQLEEANSQRLAAARKRINLLQFVLLAISIPTVIGVIIGLRQNEKKRNQLFRDLASSQKAYLFHDGREIENQLSDKKLISSLTHNLEKARAFIQEVGKGNYQTAWEGFTDELKPLNQENLTGELLKMRNKLQDIRQQDQERNWANEGINAISQIIRNNQEDLQSLSREVLSAMVKYLNVNQGGLFIALTAEEGVVLDLKACFAYNKHKVIEDKILPGEGLVGQVFIEKQTLHIDKLPENYIAITSGLGEANPRHLLLIPLTFNDTVEDVLELASLHSIAPAHVNLAEKMAGVLASALYSVKSAEENKKLLQDSQKQQEELRAQEEEMRQNMEELQATQEESRRRQTDMEDIMYAINHSLGMIEFTVDGIIIKANEQFLAAMGYRSEEISGRHHSIFMPPGKELTTEYRDFWRDLAKGKPMANRIERKRKDGSIVALNANYNPIFGPNGKVVKVIKFVQLAR